MALPATVRAERQQELVELLEERDRLVAALHEETKERKQEIRSIDQRVHDIRDILAGRTGEQQEIPGTGGVQVKTRPEKSRGGSKKFPRGSGPETPCTVCGRPFGEHAGQKCPEKGGRRA